MSTYIWFQLIICGPVLIIQIFARIYVDGTKTFACTEAGYRWVYTSMLGSMFTLFHMIIIFTQAMMMEKVFYTVPHKMGYFHNESECAHGKPINDEGETPTSDDGFKAQ